MRPMPVFAAAILALAATLAPAAADQARPWPPTVAQIHSGHSLTDTAMFQGTWPGHGIALVELLGPGEARVGKSTAPGSPMRWRRENPPGWGQPDAWNGIRDWELLVVTENNATHPEMLFPTGWEAEERAARREELRLWLDNAWKNGNRGRGAPLVYYTNWPAHGDYAPAGSWRERLAANEAEWLARIRHAEARKTSNAPPIRVIAGNALMMRIWDDAESGIVPGLANGRAFLANRGGWWLDDVHPGPYLSLALAYLHVAVIHGVDPTRLPHTGFGLGREPDAALAFYLKAAARDIARDHARPRF